MTPQAAAGKYLRITHHTRYIYAENVSLSYHQAMLEPRDAVHQRVESAKFRVEPPVRMLRRERAVISTISAFTRRA